MDRALRFGSAVQIPFILFSFSANRTAEGVSREIQSNAVAPSYRSRPCAHGSRTRGKDDETGDYPPPGGNRHLAGKSGGLDGWSGGPAVI
jgi:hypothetical protein